MQGPLCRPMPVSLLSVCLCPSFLSHPPLHQILSSCIRRPLGKPSLASQAKERTLSTVPPRQGSHDIAGPVVEPTLFLYLLGFLCVLAEPRCLQALPRPTSLGQSHGFWTYSPFLPTSSLDASRGQVAVWFSHSYLPGCDLTQFILLNKDLFFLLFTLLVH